MADAEENEDRQNPGQGQIKERIHGGCDFAGEIGSRLMEPVHQLGIIHRRCFIGLLIPFLGEKNLVLLYLHLIDFLVLRQGDEAGIIHALHFIALEHGHDEGVKEDDHQEYDDVVGQYRPLGRFDFFQCSSSLSD